MLKDYLLLGIVTIMSVVANLPDDLDIVNGLDRKLLIFGLMLVLAIALVRYSKFALVLAVAILFVGANLPHELAMTLNVDPRVLMLTLAAIVAFSLANRLLRLPSGLDKPQGFHREGAQALFGAVVNGRIEVVSRLVQTDLDLNARSRHGYTALMIAAAKGYHDIARLLLVHGADLTMVDQDGRNALQIAREADHQPCIALLLKASKNEVNRPPEAARAA